jgi:hypothetical protein
MEGPLVLDDTPFFSNFPSYLNPGDTFQATLLSVFIPPGTADAVYNGSFEIAGGRDATAPAYLDSAVCSVEVGSSEASGGEAPEPSALSTTAARLTLGVVGIRRRPHGISRGCLRTDTDKASHRVG